MNIAAPYYGAILNEDGVFRVGNTFIMPTFHAMKFVNSSDPSMIRLLREAETSNETKGIKVIELQHNAHLTSPSIAEGKPAAWTYCDDVNGKYRMIVYEESLSGFDPVEEIPCWGGIASYWLRFRSLKKVLGTWQNHSTGLWYSYSTVKLDQMKYCYHGWPTGTDISYYATPVNLSNVRISIPYGHTVDYYFLREFDLGPCSAGGFDSCVDPHDGSLSDPQGEIVYITRKHYVYGKGGTYCYVGQ